MGEDYEKFKEEETNALKMATILKQLNSPKREAVERKRKVLKQNMQGHYT